MSNLVTVEINNMSRDITSDLVIVEFNNMSTDIMYNLDTVETNNTSRDIMKHITEDTKEAFIERNIKTMNNYMLV